MNVAKLWDRVSREPVLIGAAVQAQLLASFPDWSPAARLAVGAWVALFQRGASTSKRTAAESVETAKFVGAIEHAAVSTAGQVLARPLRAKPAEPVAVEPP